jgi:hypothetical protein
MNGTLNSSTFRLVVQCIHDFVSGVLKIGEVIADHLVQCLRGFLITPCTRRLSRSGTAMLNFAAM